MDDSVDHIEDGVSEFNHCFGNELDDHIETVKQTLSQLVFILLHQMHQWWNQHGHKGHAVRLITDQVYYSINAHFMMIPQIRIHHNLKQLMNCHGRIFIFLA